MPVHDCDHVPLGLVEIVVSCKGIKAKEGVFTPAALWPERSPEVQRMLHGLSAGAEPLEACAA